MHGREFIKIANELLEGGTEEEYRTAVNRAYYAAFHTSKAFLTSLQIRVSEGAGAHGDLVRCLLGCGIASATKVGSTLGSLKTARNDADYHLYKKHICGPRARENSAKSVIMAEGIIGKIDEFSESDDCSKKIKEGIKAHLDSISGT